VGEIFVVWVFDESIVKTRVIALLLGVVSVAFVAQPRTDVQMGWLFMVGVGLLAGFCLCSVGDLPQKRYLCIKASGHRHYVSSIWGFDAFAVGAIEWFAECYQC